MNYMEDTQKDDTIRDVECFITSTPGVENKDVTPRDLLKFAKQILAWLAVIFVLSAISVMFGESTIFDVCENALPPIATLVIGYYFGASSTQQ